MEFSFIFLLILVFFCTLMLIAGLYVLANFSRLFKFRIRNELLRMNLVVWIVAICFIMALSPVSPGFYQYATSGKVMHYFLIQTIATTGVVLFVFNITWFVSEIKWVKTYPLRKEWVS